MKPFSTRILLFLFLFGAGLCPGAPVIRYLYDGYRDPDLINPNDAFGTVVNLVLGGAEPEKLRNRPLFPLGATRAYSITSLASPALFSSFMSQNGENNQGEGEYFGSFVQGFIEAPMDGDYRFRIIGNDSANFYLSTDHRTNNLKLVAHSWTNAVTAPISMKRGSKYYFEILHVQVLDANYFQLAWTRPDGAFEAPIPGHYVWSHPGASVPGPAVVSIVPTSAAVDERGSTILTCVAQTAQPAGARWRKNGEFLNGETLAFIHLKNVTVGQDGDLYEVVVTNEFGAVTSAPFRLSVVPDRTPPTVEQALTQGNPFGMKLVFSEPMNSSGMELPGNYSIDNGVNVISARRLDERTVVLETSLLEQGVVYQLRVSNLQDTAAAPNTIAGDPVAVVQVHGAITRKLFNGLPAEGVLARLLEDPRFEADQPTLLTFNTKLETPPYASNYFGVHLGGYLTPPPRESVRYGTRFQGYLTPTVTGEYTFYLASGDEGALYLSTDHLPGNKQLLAWQYPAYGRTPTTLINLSGIVGEWDFVTGNLPREYIKATGNPFSRVEPSNPAGTPSNRSAPISLQAGKRYYIEALFKDGPGYPNLAVAWERRGGLPVKDGDEPIGPEYLSAFGYSIGPVVLTNQPQSVSVEELDSASFSVGAAGSPSFFYQWLRNGTPLPGATNQSLLLSELTRAHDQDGISVVVRNAFSSITSTVARLTVRYDGVPPTISKIHGDATGQKIFIHFSESIAYDTATDLTNYVIEGLTAFSASLMGDGTRVVLSTDPQEAGKKYWVEVSNIKDMHVVPNTIEPRTRVSFISWNFIPGLIRAEYFEDLDGEQVDDLIFDVKFPAEFDHVKHLSRFSLPPNYGERYGVRLLGYFIPDVTGSHQFYIKSRHASRLYLSADDQEEGRILIAEDTESSSAFSETRPKSSLPVQLTKSERYYFEAHFKAGEGEDYLDVAVRRPGETTPASQLVPIGADRIGVITDPGLFQGDSEEVQIHRQGQEVEISWNPGVVFLLESSLSLEPSASWSVVPGSSETNRIRFPLVPSRQFFRLKSQ